MQVGLNPLTITPTGGKAATVTFTDFIACDAIEHVLDTVLLPQSVRLFFTLPDVCTFAHNAQLPSPEMVRLSTASITVPEIVLSCPDQETSRTKRRPEIKTCQLRGLRSFDIE